MYFSRVQRVANPAARVLSFAHVALSRRRRDGVENHMRKFLSLLFGLGIGWAIGALLVTFFAPLPSDELRENWQDHYERALAAGREASRKRRSELERELNELGKD